MGEEKISEVIKDKEAQVKEASKAHRKAAQAFKDGKGTMDRVATAHRRLARITGEATDAVNRWTSEIMANHPELIEDGGK